VPKALAGRGVFRQHNRQLANRRGKLLLRVIPRSHLRAGRLLGVKDWTCPARSSGTNTDGLQPAQFTSSVSCSTEKNPLNGHPPSSCIHTPSRVGIMSSTRVPS